MDALLQVGCDRFVNLLLKALPADEATARDLIKVRKVNHSGAIPYHPLTMVHLLEIPRDSTAHQK